MYPDYAELDTEDLIERMRQRQNGHALPDVMYGFPPPPMHGRVAFASLPGAGKKTLYNSLWGWEVLTRDAPRPGIHKLGSFSLVELPTILHNAEDYLMQLEAYDVIVYLLDATQGLRSDDFQWVARLRAFNKPLMLVLNKANLLDGDSLDKVAADLKQKLALPVLALDASDADAVHAAFLPELLKNCPDMGATLAKEITSLRRHVALHFIKQAVMKSSTMALENQPDGDVSALVDVQMHMLKQVAGVYGQAFSGQGRAEMSLLTFCATLSYQFTQHFSRMLSGMGWMSSRFFAALTTWLIGQSALVYYSGSSLKFWKPGADA